MNSLDRATREISAPVRSDAVLSREADHRIANNLGLIGSLLRMRARAVGQQDAPMDPADVVALLNDIAARIETVSQLHRMLSQSYRDAMLDIGSYLGDLCESLTETLAPQARVHITHHSTGACVLPADQILALGLLMSELVTNSVKYAHPAGLPVRIDIDCSQNDRGNLVIEYADDGVGLPEDFNPETGGGLGIKVVRSLASQLGGSVMFHSGELGIRVQLEMPL
jgi:two-component sensor histidine kinase